MAGRVDDYEESLTNQPSESDENNVSNWLPNLENSTLEELECDDPYSQRIIGENQKFPGKIRSVPLAILVSIPNLILSM